MTHITIKNVGPIKNVEFDLNKVNVFMGPQSSGKSTIAKIISYCSWYEKNYILESKSLKDFYSELLEFHNLEDTYFNDDSYIEYQSKNCHIVFNGSDKKDVKKTAIVDFDNIFKNEKIEYIPAERNVVAISGIGEYNKTNNNILGFLYDWFEAKREKKKDSLFALPLQTLGSIRYYYSQEDDTDHLIIEKDKEIRLQHSSSGLISVTPLLIVFDYCLNGVYLKDRLKSPFEKINIDSKVEHFDKEIRDGIEKIINQIKDTRIKVNEAKDRLAKLSYKEDDMPVQLKGEVEQLKMELAELEKYTDLSQNELIKTIGYVANYCYSKVIIEEPELNLFPNTQQELMYYMLSLLNSDERDHQLVLTTHSPYILFSLNNCMMGGLVKNNIPEEDKNSFASHHAWIDPKEVSIWEIEKGEIRRIQDKDGILEDNYLNKAYKENSAEYMSLLNYFEDEE